VPAEWQPHDPAAAALFEALRALGSATIRVHLALEIRDGWQVGIPAVSLTLSGRLRLHPGVERLTVELAGGGEARLGRRSERGGRPPYWQAYCEWPAQDDGDHPPLVLSLTAPLDAVAISTRRLREASRE